MTNLRRLLPWIAATVAALGSIAVYVALIEPRSLRVRRFIIGVPGLAPQLEGLRVAYLTDFHVSGPGHYERSLTREALERLEQERPELVLLGGDYFDEARPRGREPEFDPLASFPHVVGVLGNHDHRRRGLGPAAIRALLERRGARILQNESIEIDVRGVPVTIAGIDDPYTGHDDLEATLRHARHPLVFLAHASSIVSDLPVGCASLILCGHTHGGQVRLSPVDTLTPLDSTWYLDRQLGRPLSHYQRGFHWVRGALVYVSNGIGTTRLPIRFLAPPEILVFHLTAEAPNTDEPCDSPDRYVEEIS